MDSRVVHWLVECIWFCCFQFISMVLLLFQAVYLLSGRQLDFSYGVRIVCLPKSPLLQELSFTCLFLRCTVLMLVKSS